MATINLTTNSNYESVTVTDNPDCGTQGIFDDDPKVCRDTVLIDGQPLTAFFDIRQATFERLGFGDYPAGMSFSDMAYWVQNPGPRLQDAWQKFETETRQYEDASLFPNDLDAYQDFLSRFKQLQEETHRFLSLDTALNDLKINDSLWSIHWNIQTSLNHVKSILDNITISHSDEARKLLISGNATEADSHLKIARWTAVTLADPSLIDKVNSAEDTEKNRLLNYMSMHDLENLDGDGWGSAITGLTTSTSWANDGGFETRLGRTYSDNSQSYSRLGIARALASTGVLYGSADTDHHAGIFLSGNTFAGLRFSPVTAAVVGAKLELDNDYTFVGKEVNAAMTGKFIVNEKGKFTLNETDKFILDNADIDSSRVAFGASGKVYTGIVFDFGLGGDSPYRVNMGITGSLARADLSTRDESFHATLNPEMEAFLELTLDP